MSLSDYGITLENTETVLLLAAAVAAVAIFMTVFLRAVCAFAQYRLMRAANGRGAWRAFVPVLSLSALGDLAAEHNPRVRFAGKAAAAFSLLCALTFYCGAVFFFDSLLRHGPRFLPRFTSCLPGLFYGLLSRFSPPYA